MSWWIKDTIAQEVRTNYSYALIEIECDNFASLPSYDQTSTLQIQIARGSKAEVLENSKTYKLNSSNVWVEQKSGLEISADDIVYDNTSSGMTATNVQDAIDELHDTDETQDTAIAELTGENASQQAEIDYAINTGAKNLLKTTVAYGQMVKTNITFTHNDDETITVTSSSANTSYTDYYVSANAVTLSPGTYILSGCPSGGNNSTTYKLHAAGIGYDTGDGFEFTISQDTTVNVYIRIWGGYVPNNLVFKPMIRRVEITDDTFQPYAPTNRELYELCETKASLNDIYGIKNQLPNGTDLNNLTAGCMTCTGATVAASLLNCPTTTDAFIIYTDYLAVSSRVIQRIYSFSTTTGIPSQYMRVRWSQGWAPWYQVMMQQVASVSTQSVNQVSTLNLSRNDLDESLDSNFDLIDSIPEEEEGEEDDI